jgi:hypothetical protein
MQKLILLIFSLFFFTASFVHAQQQVIGKGNAFIFGADSVPTDNLKADTVFFYNRLNSNLYSGILGFGLNSYPDKDSLGYCSAGFGYNVFPKGEFSFSAGGSNFSNADGSSTIGGALINNSFLGTAIGTYNDPILSTPGSFIQNATPVLMVGNGSGVIASDDYRKNALTVYFDGRVNINEAYTLPPFDGDSSQVLRTDGNGNLNWQDAKGAFENVDNVIKPMDNATSDFVVGSSTLPAGITNDTMMFFDVNKGAFRAGSVTGDRWQSTKLGQNSFAAGLNTEASGFNSTALGSVTSAKGSYSFAAGYATIANNFYSTTFGSSTRANGVVSTAMGHVTIADAVYSTALGSYNVGGGNNNFWFDFDPILEVGIGKADTARENALTILKNGTVSFKDYTFPNADGTADQILSTDGSGNLGWVDKSISGVFEDDGTTIQPIGNSDRDFLFGIDAIPGTGVTSDRMIIFDENKGAFRAGGVASDAWAKDSIGFFSAAFGLNNFATGVYSTAMGNRTKARGLRSTSTGYYSEANGDYSFSGGNRSLANGESSVAFGDRSRASGNFSFAVGDSAFVSSSASAAAAFGYQTLAEGSYSLAGGFGSYSAGVGSLAFGKLNIANGDWAIAMGDQSSANKTGSVSIGYQATANGAYSAAFNANTNANAYASSAFGRYNVGSGDEDAWNPEDPIFEIGNGDANSNRSNALTVTKEGDVLFERYRAPLPGVVENGGGFFYHAAKNSIRTGNLPNLATTSDSLGLNSVGMGNLPRAKGPNSVAIGDENTATKLGSFAGGKQSESHSTAGVALGFHTLTKSSRSVSIGSYNVGLGVDPSDWVGTDPIFEVGIGQSEATRENALTIIKSGNIGIGTTTPDKELDIEGTQRIKRNSSSSFPHLELVEQGEDWSRLKFYNDVVNTDDYWNLAGRVHATLGSSTFNMFFSDYGNVLSAEGDGDVIIGERLGVNIVNNTPVAAIQANSNAGSDALRIQVDNVTKMRVYDDGHVSLGGNVDSGTPNDVFIVNQLGMGVPSPVYRIDIQNSTSASLGKGRANEWLSLSDARVKKKVSSIDYGLKEVLQLRPVKYNHHSSQFTNDGLDVMSEHSPEIGFLAQEVFQVIQEIVEKPIDDSKDLWSMNYEKLTPVLVKAIQELNDDKMEMENKLAIQQKLIDKLILQNNNQSYQMATQQTQLDRLIEKAESLIKQSN